MILFMVILHPSLGMFSHTVDLSLWELCYRKRYNNKHQFICFRQHFLMHKTAPYSDTAEKRHACESKAGFVFIYFFRCESRLTRPDSTQTYVMHALAAI